VKVKMLKSTKFKSKAYVKGETYTGDLSTLVVSGVAVEVAEEKRKPGRPKKSDD
jgi:hypothetical protein